MLDTLRGRVGRASRLVGAFEIRSPPGDEIQESEQSSPRRLGDDGDLLGDAWAATEGVVTAVSARSRCPVPLRHGFSDLGMVGPRSRPPRKGQR